VAAGGSFRIIAVTAQTTDAGGWNSYTQWDNFVNTTANTYGGVTYQSQAVTGWLPMVSVGATNARDHIGGYQTNVPFYLVDGTLVAPSATTTSGGLWSATYVAGTGFATKINLTLDGSVKNGNNVWSNTQGDGTSLGGNWDYYSNTAAGNTTTRAGSFPRGWIYNGNNTVGTANNYVYMVSPVLTASAAVPEIDPAMGSSALSLVAGVLAMIEQRRRRAILVA
jgi:hypothetical protein